MSSSGKFSFKAFLCFWLILAAALRCSALLAAEVDVIRVQYRRAAELVPVIQALLSVKGTVTVSERTNSLVVVDTPEAIQRVHAYLERFDRPVVAMSGSPAFIRTGKEIPYQHGPAFFRRYAPGEGTTAWQNVESGFEVTPTIVGDNVHLKIVPRLAYDDRKDAVIRFFAAQTELTTTMGEWVEIGGVDDQRNEIVKEILSQHRGGKNAATSMYLMVERP